VLRSEFQGACSRFEVIFARSRGFASSCHDSMPSNDGAEPAMKGACDAAETLAMAPSSSTSGGVWSK
jgi:hypothetical protein